MLLPLVFPATYTRMLVRELRLNEAGIQQLLAGTRITSADLFQLDRYVTVQDQYQMIRNALTLAKEPALGLQVGFRMPLSAHGSMGVAASSAATPLQSLDIFDRFGILRLPVMHMQRKVEGAMLSVHLYSDIPFDEVGIFLLEALIASIFWVIEHALGQPVSQSELDLPYPVPSYAERYHDFFHANIRFAQPVTCIRLPLSLLNTPNPFADAEVHQQAVQQCEHLRLSLQAQESWRLRVLRVLQQHPGQLWTIAEVAQVLHVSVRSLTRHLQAEQCSYQHVLDEELTRQAQLHLGRAGHTVASVAATLGYHDVSAFRRAFKRWLGVTPQQWLETANKL